MSDRPSLGPWVAIDFDGEAKFLDAMLSFWPTPYCCAFCDIDISHKTGWKPMVLLHMRAGRCHQIDIVVVCGTCVKEQAEKLRSESA